MDYLFYGINNVKSLYYSWYFSVLFTYAFFILIYNNSSINSIIENINKVMSDENLKENKSLSELNLSVKPFIVFITELYNKPQKQKYEFNWTKNALKEKKGLFKLLLSLIKTMLNVKYFCGIQNINSNSDIYNKLEVLLNNNKY